MIALKDPVFNSKGPRDWSPRVDAALRKVEFLVSLIPPEVLDTSPPRECQWDSLTGKEMCLAVVVRSRKWKKPWTPEQFELLNDNIWIGDDGRIVTECGIRELLSGEVEGYEHLAGRWETWLEACMDRSSVRTRIRR